MNTKSEQQEIAKFNALANNWWSKEGELKTLHDINPTRMKFIQDQIELPGLIALDVGCGGGILTESLAVAGAVVTGIDASEAAIEAAKHHSRQAGLDINYQCIMIDDFAKQHPHHFDIVTCLELLEHVDNPAAVIKSCANMVKSGGMLFFSTLNRTTKAYLFAILAAEYVFRLLPMQTHDYTKFIRPAELAVWLRAESLELVKLIGMDYNPLTGAASLVPNVDINYLVCCVKK